jgi:hypothetical protein
MGKRIGAVVLCLLLALCAGCSNLGFMQYSNNTTTELRGNNYRVLKSNVRGESVGFSVLFLPIVSPSYADAMSNLHENVAMEGKATALANVAHDVGSLNLILFSFPRMVITADVIEFTDQPSQE